MSGTLPLPVERSFLHAKVYENLRLCTGTILEYASVKPTTWMHYEARRTLKQTQVLLKLRINSTPNFAATVTGHGNIKTYLYKYKIIEFKVLL
jgi:hypothetical protein